MKDELYAHFHPDERPFIDRVDDWLRLTTERHAVRLTDFLDPRQCYIVDALSRMHGDLQVTFAGGYEAAERKRARIAPDYRVFDDDETLEIALLAVTSEDERFAELDHGDILGALLGLGIKRDKIGDIHLHPDMCHVLLCEDMAEYVRLHLHQVHRLAVRTEPLQLEQLRVVEPQWEERMLTVASLRLDAIVSDLIRTSRAKTLPFIRAGQCRVNWKPEQNPSCPLEEGDVLSIRGHGRFKLLSVDGVTKKGNARVKIGRMV